ncbi:hypothetical protein C8A00DRAFT_42670 [Chaetomidium leptoderma]|uniref:Uncharacterized protein n=1 Tax=Chaetomidium leptoderma TaxID=669021 RepID=A0AAN6VNP2_9PEZI|nr:hypothetical protein C8A00DRAFT_42670 [Chaetomidium leptoderma]
MSVTNTDLTVGSLSGTPVLFWPVPTPWPSSSGCDEYLYRQWGDGTILAWDPVYTSFGTGSESCLSPQQRWWWLQGTTQDPSKALGPTFVCPEAYNAVRSTVLDRNTEAQTQFTYCCPPSIIQCTSTATPGVTLSYQSLTFLFDTLTATGEDGTVTRQTNTRNTNVAASTVVQSSAATVYAPAVNGYNLVRGQGQGQGQAGTSATDTGAARSDTGAAATTPPPPGTSSDVSTTQCSGSAAQPSGGAPLLAPGAIAGIVVGAVLGLGLLALGAFFVQKRYRHSEAAVDRPDPVTWKGGAARDYYYNGGGPPPHGLVASEMPVGNQAQELPHGIYAHELPGAK